MSADGTLQVTMEQHYDTFIVSLSCLELSALPLPLSVDLIIVNFVGNLLTLLFRRRKTLRRSPARGSIGCEYRFHSGQSRMYRNYFNPRESTNTVFGPEALGQTSELKATARPKGSRS